MAGGVAAMGSITYPSISAFASSHAEPDQQGKVLCSAQLLHHASGIVMCVSPL